MFSFIQRISKLYAFVLILLSVIVTFASVTIVSMVHSHESYEKILDSLSKQRHYSERIINEIFLTTITNDERKKYHHVLVAKQLLSSLKEEHSYFDIITKDPSESIYDLIWSDVSFPKHLLSETQKNYSTVNQNKLMAYIDMLLPQLNSLDKNIRNKALKNLASELENNNSIIVFSMLLRKVEELHEKSFNIHKNLLLLCICLFIGLIIIEALLIYRPFSFRLDEKIAALEKEQDFIAVTKDNIKQMEDRINLALKGANIGIFDWHITEDKLFLSSSACHILNIPPNRDAETSFIDINQFKTFIHESDLSFFNKALDAHLKHNKILNIDIRLNPQNISNLDKTIWLNISGQGKWSDTGNAQRLAGIIKDITTEKANEDLKKIFMSGVETSNLAMAIINITHSGCELVYASPGLSHLLGFEETQILNSNMYMLNGPDTKMEHIDRIDAIFESGKRGELEITHYRADGTPFLDKMVLVPVFDEQANRVTAYVSFHENMSEKITYSAFDISRQRKEAISHLVKSVTPEILSLLSELAETTRKNEHIKIERLLALQTSIAGFFDDHAAKNKQIEISSALSNAIEDNKYIFKNMSIIQNNAIDNEDLLAFINDIELRQILFNLISNAAHSYENTDKTPQIEITIKNKTISFVEAETLGLPKHNQEYVSIEIKDNGCGIEDTQQTKVFDPLHANWNHTQTTGLGLTVAQTVLKGWGGSIALKSIKNEGTTVICYIPVYRSQEDKDFIEMADLLDELNTGIIQPL